MFFVASITLIVVMINVLIAIASNSLNNTEVEKVEYSFKERVGLIAEL